MFMGLDKLKEDLKKLLECPVDWGNEFPCKHLDDSTIENFSNHMSMFWKTICEKYQVDMEANYINTDEILLDGDLHLEIFGDDEDFIRGECMNIRSWIDGATKEFIDKARRFRDLRMASPQDHGKHYPKAFMNDKQIKEFTKQKRISLFYKQISFEWLERVVWAIIVDEEKWQEMMYVYKCKFFVDCMCVIGCSAGKEASNICFDFDLSTPIVHAYPVLKNGIRKSTKGNVLFIDDLQGVYTP